MKLRAPLVLAGTAAGLAGVLSYHTHSTTLSVGSRSATAGPPSTPAPSTGSGGSSTGSAGPPASGPPASAPPASAAPTNQTATGPTVQYGYGQLAVQITLSGGKITDVSVPTLQVADYTSQYIAQQAIPLLKRQVLSAQSANIQGVSGATYTSQAYDQSLQSALTKAKQG